MPARPLLTFGPPPRVNLGLEESIGPAGCNPFRPCNARQPRLAASHTSGEQPHTRIVGTVLQARVQRRQSLVKSLNPLQHLVHTDIRHRGLPSAAFVRSPRQQECQRSEQPSDGRPCIPVPSAEACVTPRERAAGSDRCPTGRTTGNFSRRFRNTGGGATCPCPRCLSDAERVLERLPR
jgi:hypothetical protein